MTATLSFIGDGTGPWDTLNKRTTSESAQPRPATLAHADPLQRDRANGRDVDWFLLASHQAAPLQSGGRK
jgi:hypothetical protein